MTHLFKRFPAPELNDTNRLKMGFEEFKNLIDGHVGIEKSLDRMAKASSTGMRWYDHVLEERRKCDREGLKI